MLLDDMLVTTVILFGSIPLALVLSGVAAVKCMTRWNSRAVSIGAASFSGGITVALATLLGLYSAPQEAWHGGGMFAYGMFGVFATGFCFVVGGLIAAFIAVGMRIPEDTIWSDLDGDSRGYRSKLDDERYG